MFRTACVLAAVSIWLGVATYPVPISSPDAQVAAPPEIKMPAGYRDWRLISVAHEEGNLNDIRAVLGNDMAIKAYRTGQRPFPDGAIIARLAWAYVPSETNNQVFGKRQSYVAGKPVNGVQFMIKDSHKYAATGGWGYAQFNAGQPASPAVNLACHPCHQAIQAHDFVFTEYAP